MAILSGSCFCGDYDAFTTKDESYTSRVCASLMRTKCIDPVRISVMFTGGCKHWNFKLNSKVIIVAAKIAATKYSPRIP